MVDVVQVRPDTYVDSVTLMRVSRDVRGEPGVREAAVVLATPLNLELVRARGFEPSEPLGPHDLVIAVRADSREDAEAAVAAVDRWLAERAPGAWGGEAAEAPPRSVTSAARRDPGLSLALVSVPRPHAAFEVAAALEAGLHVFCFSDGVGVAEEAALKRRALERGLLLMGPDCGTAILDGVPLGFANAVELGPVGIVGASGTGIQEVCCLLDLAGVGVSHAVGVGGRDLWGEVGGPMTLRGLELLAQDPGTEVLVVVAKRPDPEVAARVVEAAGATGKPAVVAFLGADGTSRGGPPRVEVVGGIEEAASRVAALLGRELPPLGQDSPPGLTPGLIRGLFCGGSLCDEVMSVVSRAVGPVRSNIPGRPEWALEDVWASEGHTFIDFGDDRLTEGRPHPMIDPSLRNERLAKEAADPEVGVVVLDVVLGYGAHPDPAAELAPLIEGALAARGDGLSVVVDVCGSARDPQDTRGQIERLRSSGAVVTRSAAQAGRLALRAAGAWG